MSFLSIESFAEILAREWLKLYSHSPRLTVLSTIAISLFIGGTIYLTEQKAQTQRDAKRLQNLNYAAQVQKLEETRSNLQALLEFVDEEHRNLQTSEQAFQSLKQRHDELKPLVESDQKTIDALFAAQEARNQAAQNIEKWIGFGLGVLSSLVASFIWAFFSFLRHRRQSEPVA
jgi:predicted PurR-regulated permease PerM